MLKVIKNAKKRETFNEQNPELVDITIPLLATVPPLRCIMQNASNVTVNIVIQVD